MWQLTNARCTPDFWNKHSATELRSWKDHDLEMTGRLTHPTRFDHATDRYVEVTCDEAFEKIGRTL
ncbi:hypothetical protein [Aliirhizobium cellulosilyticum]|uniref:Anaerobic selenocysteine-containing dehydrogenase n=1 Tax=Aliirhizobium cellulosilyticum TaxID=393664 RepID=A0A7W6TKB7_9HYPH|nr:anaerobic selenocysteine-containing dehydrogenase [Rhizobium cellulosilyticum]MBB4414949.1 anaerobic selenocysteine-containing dehydrogenase [Rhizobium cellulosilyticum]MBB4449672.1 anaerobic selenocysteine-containing dehydrogenase [Rhizobium cellulosilyticum]